MPPKTRKFLGIIHEKLYRNELDDHYLVFEEADFRKAWFSVAEIEEILDFLKRSKVIARWRIYRVPKEALFLPLAREEKAKRLTWSLKEVFSGEKPKRRYAVELASRDAFLQFYRQPMSHNVIVPPKVAEKPHKFPLGLQWNEITIQFLNGNEVIIKFKDQNRHTTFEEMGFRDERKKTPNKQWELLNLLAVRGGELSWENNSNMNLTRINAIKKQKQLLAEALQKYFEIETDPFHPYKQEGAYKIKISLIPEDGGTARKDDLGIQEFLRDETPQVYEQGDFTED
jgi:hypothetical protein